MSGDGRVSKITVLQMEEEEKEPKGWLFKLLYLSTEGDGEDVGNVEGSRYVRDVSPHLVSFLG